MTAAELQSFLDKAFEANHLTILSADKVGARVHMKIGKPHLRPGNTISGPAMMGLADAAMYIALLSRIGMIALAVTTNFNINFLRRPKAENIIAEAKILKLGKRLAVGEITIFTEGEDDPVAHATCTYSIPEKKL
jgi:uncharacterized protein (TIGR00369 family)